MTKSATDVMQEIIFSAVIDSIGALKAASKGVPNTLLRDLSAVHANTTLSDLPQDLQAAIAANVRAAFTRLLKEGYSVSPGRPAPAPRIATPQRDRTDKVPPHGRPPARPGTTDPRKPRGGGRPSRPPKPRGS